MKKLILLLIFVVISGCATTFTPEEISKAKSADYGKYPENYDSIIKSYLVSEKNFSKETLNSEGIWYPSGNPEKYFYKDIYCYSIAASPNINKNVPNPIFFFLIKNDKIIDYSGGGSSPYDMGAVRGGLDRMRAIKAALSQ